MGDKTNITKCIFQLISKLTYNNDIRHVINSVGTESGSAGVLSSLRRCCSTECEDTGHLLPTSGGVSWGRSYSRSKPLKVWNTSYSSRQSDRAGESDQVSSHDGGGGRGERERWWLALVKQREQNNEIQCAVCHNEKL